MTHHIERYLKLKRHAMHFMLNGDVAQYMRALRLMTRLTLR